MCANVLSRTNSIAKNQHIKYQIRIYKSTLYISKTDIPSSAEKFFLLRIFIFQKKNRRIDRKFKWKLYLRFSYM